jgi:DNA modification methylase
VALAYYAFEKYGKARDVIIDPFLGSGISVIAAEQIGDRQVIGCELAPEYIAIVIQRWADVTKKEPKLL